MGDLWSIFASQEPAGVAVDLLILCLFLIALWDVGKGLRKLREEVGVIGEAGRRLKALAATPEGGDGAKTGLPVGPTDAVLSALGVPEHSLLGMRLARILEMRKAGLGYRDVLQKLTIERVEGFGSHSRFIATILTLLGLVGTVVGMSFAMLRISGAFQSSGGGADAEQLSRLTQALNGTLEGMKTAFGCTLAGLSGAVLLAAANHFLRRRQSNVAATLEDFLVSELLPVLEKVDPEEDNSSRSVATALANAAEKIESLTSVMVISGENFENAGKQMSGAISALGSAATEFSEAASAMVGSHAEFTATMASTRTAVEGLSQTMRAELERMHAFSAQTAQALHAELERIHAFSTQAGQAMHAELERIHAFSTQAANEFEKRLKVIEAAQADIRSHNETFEKFAERTAVHQEAAVRRMLGEVRQQFQDGMGRLISEHSTKLQGFSDLMLEAMVRRPAAREESNGKNARKDQGGKA
jgi:MotA/TolQ/ExbB proton channel family